MSDQVDNRIKAYIPDDDLVWVAVEIISEENPGEYSVEIVDDEYTSYPKVKTVNLQHYPQLSALPLQNDELATMGSIGVDDMTVLNFLHEPSILDNIRRRFLAKIPYTYTGEICVAINPYKWLPLYTDDLRVKYSQHLRHELKPHVYAISAAAYQGLSKYGRNQSILVSGESGAGKTETVKILMGHLASISGKRNSGVIEKVLQANPLMETFGNAKTARNDNSSRFGKFTRLQFDSVNMLAGSKCDTYLLEKSRVVNQNEGERNYHIFHQLFCAPEDCKAQLHMGGLSAGDFLYTNGGDIETNIIEDVSDGDRFHQTLSTLSLLGIDERTQDELLRVIAGVLYLGQVIFEGDLDRSSIDENYAENMSICCDLLGLNDEDFCSKTTSRTIEAEGKQMTISLSRDQAFDSRDALAKDLYDKLFRWLVFVLNRSTSASPKDLAGIKQEKLISLLDIFGFEAFYLNRFEQLCINFANEKLQQKFTKDIFQAVQQEYRDEGLQWQTIGYKDNSDVLELFEGKMGIISLLNEDCLMPNGSDTNFISKLQNACKQHPCFLASTALNNKDEFTVAHFAGQVTYCVAGFVERNRDAIPNELTTIMMNSTISLIRDCYSEHVSGAAVAAVPTTPSAIAANASFRRGVSPMKLSQQNQASSSRKGFMKADTVTTKFRGQLDQLMLEISRTAVQYVRCIKPNGTKSSEYFDRPMIVSQLRCAGMIEAIRISRAAYPYRVTHNEFLMRFAQLRPRLAKKLKEFAQSPYDQCSLLLQDIWPNQSYLGLKASSDSSLRGGRGGNGAAGLSDKAYEVGKSKVYFSNGVLESLEAIRGSLIHAHVVIIQSQFRSSIARKRYHLVRRQVVLLQTFFRKLFKKKQFALIKSAICSLQVYVRVLLAKKFVKDLKLNLLVCRIQSVARMFVDRRKFLRINKKWKLLRNWLLSKYYRRKYLIRILHIREEKKLRRQIALIECELETERSRRIALEQQLRDGVEPQQLKRRDAAETETETEVKANDDSSFEDIYILRKANAELIELIKERDNQIVEFVEEQQKKDMQINNLQMQNESISLVYQTISDEISGRLSAENELLISNMQSKHQSELNELQLRLEQQFKLKYECDLEILTTQMKEEIEEEAKCFEDQMRENLEKQKLELENMFSSQLNSLELSNKQLQKLLAEQEQKAVNQSQQLDTAPSASASVSSSLSPSASDQLQQQQQQQIEELQKQELQLKEIQKELQKELQKQRHVVAEKESAIKELNFRLDVTTNEKFEIQKNLTNLQVNFMDEMSSTGAELSVLKQSEGELRASNSQLTMTVETQKKVMKDTIEYTDKLNSELKQLRQAQSDAERRKEVEISQLKDNWSKEQSSCANVIANLKIEVESKSIELRNMSAKAKELEENNNFLSKQTEKQSKEIISLEKLNAELAENLNSMQLEHKTKNELIVQLKGTLEQELNEKQLLQKRFAERENELKSDLFAGNNSASDRNANLEKQNKILYEELQLLKSLHNELSDEIAHLKRCEAAEAESPSRSQLNSARGDGSKRRQSDLYSELIELKAKNDILMKEMNSIRAKSALPFHSGASIVSSSAITLPMNSVEGVEKEVLTLRKEKDLYIAEKKVLLELLNSQCDELDAVDQARQEVERMLVHEQQSRDYNMKQVLGLLKSARINIDILSKVETLLLQAKPIPYSKASDEADSVNQSNRPGHVVSKRGASKVRSASTSRPSRSKSPGNKSRSKSPSMSRSSRRSSRSPSRAYSGRSRSRGRRAADVLDRDEAQSVISSVSTHKARPPSTPVAGSGLNGLDAAAVNSHRANTTPGTAAAVASPRNSGNPALQAGANISNMQLSGLAGQGGNSWRSPMESLNNATKSIQPNQGIPSPIGRNMIITGQQNNEILNSPSAKTKQALQQSLQFQPPKRVQSQHISSMRSPLAFPGAVANAGVDYAAANSLSSPFGLPMSTASPTPTAPPTHGRPVPQRALSQQMPTSKLLVPSPLAAAPSASMGAQHVHTHSSAMPTSGAAVAAVGSGVANSASLSIEEPNSSPRNKKQDANFWAFF